MAHQVRKPHWQFLGLVLAVLGLILTAGISGVNDWRVWYLDDLSIIDSGLAWVGIWRVCFYSHVLDTFELCQSISITDSFVPPEIAAGQVLCMVAIPIGVVGNLVAGYGVKLMYSNANGGRTRWAFPLAGALYLLTATCSLVPVFWNMNSVLENRTIDFPPEFHLPAAPNRQKVGMGIVIGIGSSVLFIVSGLLFLLFRQTAIPPKNSTETAGTNEQGHDHANHRSSESLGAITEVVDKGTDNPSFKTETL